MAEGLPDHGAITTVTTGTAIACISYRSIPRCRKSARRMIGIPSYWPIRSRALSFVTMQSDPAAIAPDVHIFTRSKLPWVGLPAEVPAYEVFYASPDEVWSPEALARREAASKAAR